jgi:prevent-host-death family protein
MKKIQLRDAKAHFSAVVAAAVRGEPSIITKHGRAEAVILSVSAWERLTRMPSFERAPMSAPFDEGLPAREETPVAGE